MSVRLLSRGSPDQVSGGYLYNKYLMTHLRHAGLEVTYHAAAATVAQFAAHDTVIVDSLVAAEVAERLPPSTAKPVLLLHMVPAGDESRLEALYRRSRIVVTGDSTLTCLRERLASDEIDAIKIEPGVPTHWRSKRGYANTACRILTVANYIDGKGIERVLEVLRSLTHLPWSWTVFGNNALDPEYYAAIERKAAAYDLTNRVRLCGPISHESVNEQMIASDLLVQLSRHESYSMVTAEAIAAGLPVLSYRTGNYRAFRGSGLVYYADDEAQVGDALETLILDGRAYGALRRVGSPPPRSWSDVGREFLGWLGTAQ